MSERNGVDVNRLVRRSVRLPKQDWADLIHFVEGDLDNMDPDEEVCQQMRRIMKTIFNTIHKPNVRAERPERKESK